MGKIQSEINIDNLHYKAIPPRPPAGAPDLSYLVYSSDRSATIDDPYFAQTPPVKGTNGVMMFIRGKSQLPLDDSWVVLGHTYYEVWSDPKKLALYNSLYPPDEDGLPRPFGFFAGAENEMAGSVGRNMPAPTTRAADILDFSWPQQGK